MALQNQIVLPADAEPALANLPAIGAWIDMPGAPGADFQLGRITDRESGNARSHNYSKRSVLNRTGEYAILNASILLASDFSTFDGSVPLGYERAWAKTEDYEIYGISGITLRKWNVVTKVSSTVWTAPTGASGLTIGGFEGDSSDNDRYWPIAYTIGGAKYAVVVDLNTGLTSGTAVNVDTLDAFAYNWHDVSRDGNWVLIGTDGRIYRYSINMTGKYQMTQTYGGNIHGDLTVDAAGNQVYVHMERTNDTKQLRYVEIATDIQHKLTPFASATDSAAHISACGPHGSVLVSMEPVASGYSTIFEMDLVPNGTQVEIWGWSFTDSNSYLSQAKASMSSDGNTVVWASDHNSAGSDPYLLIARRKTSSAPQITTNYEFEAERTATANLYTLDNGTDTTPPATAPDFAMSAPGNIDMWVRTTDAWINGSTWRYKQVQIASEPLLSNVTISGNQITATGATENTYRIQAILVGPDGSTVLGVLHYDWIVSAASSGAKDFTTGSLSVGVPRVGDRTVVVSGMITGTVGNLAVLAGTDYAMIDANGNVQIDVDKIVEDQVGLTKTGNNFSVDVSITLGFN